MALLSQADGMQVFNLLREVHDQARGGETVEEAARRTLDLLYERYAEALVLARVYATMPYQKLPAFNRDFVEKLSAKLGSPLKPTTPVLSLMATRGVAKEWNDRKLSAGHVGVPLLSEEVVRRLPMVARLGLDLGLDLKSLDAELPRLEILESHRARMFYVADAATALDEHQRKIIPAQDFVAEHQVRTVFGTGATYADGTLVALLFFTREALEQAVVERFWSLGSMFKSATLAMVKKGQFFAG